MLDHLIVRGCPCGANRRKNPSTRRRDLGIGGAAETLPQFIAPISGKHHMRVGIDETRNERMATAIDDDGAGARGEPCADILRTPGRDDSWSVARNGTVSDRGDVTLSRTRTGSGTGHGVKLLEVFDQESDAHFTPNDRV